MYAGMIADVLTACRSPRSQGAASAKEDVGAAGEVAWQGAEVGDGGVVAGWDGDVDVAGAGTGWRVGIRDGEGCLGSD